MALAAISPPPVALTHDWDYQATIAHIKQLPPYTNSTEGPGPTGIFPLVIDGTFQEGEIDLPSGGTRRVIATQLTAINRYTIDKIDLIQAIREKKLASYHVENGIITILSVHHEWYNRIERENAWTVAARIEINGNYSVPEENDDIGLAKMPEESYLNMIRTFGLENLIKVSVKKGNDCIIL